MKKFLLITLALILAACSAGGSEFSRNQKTWNTANVKHYRFELSISCFCAFRDQMPLAIEVLDGQIVSMLGADGTVIPDTDPNYAFFAEYATVDGLFTKLDAALNSDAEEVTAKYDATYGFPTEIVIDQSKQMADEELYLYASGFEALP
jgi:hypothetical protein